MLSVYPMTFFYESPEMIDILNRILNVAVILCFVAAIATLVNVNIDIDFLAKGNLPFTLCGILVATIAIFTIKELR